MTNFQSALNTGRVLVLQSFPNRNGKDKVTVQFEQRVAVPKDTLTGSNGASAGVSSLVAIANGITDVGYNKVTALLSFTPEAAAAKGLVVLSAADNTYTPINFRELDQVMFADDIFGEEVAIKVTENFMPNTLGKVAQEPRKNPTTGEPIAYNGKPIYRHTELSPASTAKSLFMNEQRAIELSAELNKAPIVIATAPVGEVVDTEGNF